MSEFSDHFDKTIWERGGEGAVEDPFHGPSAVLRMLQNPPMSLGDGTYYQTGLYSVANTAYMDSRGMPVHRFRIDLTGAASARELDDLREWLSACAEGEAAMIALEASRQQARLRNNGVAHCFRPTDVCPGGKQLAECEVGQKAFDAGEEWAMQQTTEKTGSGTVSNVLAWAGSKCGECALACQVTVKTTDGLPKETCVTFYEPRVPGPDDLVIKIDTEALRTPREDAHNQEAVHQVVEALEKLRPRENP